MKRIDPLKFFTALKWIDGRRLMDVLMPYQTDEIKKAFWSFRDDGSPQFIRILLGRAKKNAKTLTGVLVALWTLLMWKADGNRGNQVYFIASDLGQANDDLELTKKLFFCNPILKDKVVIRANRIERVDGQGFIEILPAGDVAGLHGKTYLLLVFDEFHTARDYKVLEALELDRTRPDARQLFLSYASPYRHKGIPLVDVLKQHEAQTDPRLYVSWYAGTIEEANPSLNGPLGPTLPDIEQARISLPSWIFRRLYLNLGGLPDGSAYDADVVESCIVKGRTVLPPVRGIDYRAFVDPSGGGADNFTLGIAHKAQDKGILDLVLDQGARAGKTFDPNQAVERFATVLKEYRIAHVVGDRYAGEWPRKAFEAKGIGYELSEKTKSEIFTEGEPLLNSGCLELLDHPVLFAQMLGLVRKGTRIDHVGSEHDDLANSAIGALVLARQESEMRIRFV